MPPDRPGRLSDQTYTDLIAFLLSNNGYAPGSRELPSDAADQQKMMLRVDKKGENLDAVTKDWIDQHESVWQPWMKAAQS